MKISTFVTICFILGFLFISNSITGMYLLDWEKIGKNYCTKDNGCSENLVCCKFYEENVGVCAKKSECKSIYILTMETKSQQTSTGSQITPTERVKSIESPLNTSSNILLLLAGLLLIILGLITKKKYPKRFKKRLKVH